MKLDTLQADVPCLEGEIVGKIVRYGQKRIRGWELETLPFAKCSEPEYEAPIVENNQIEIGEFLGRGSFSAAYEVKRIQNRPTKNLVIKMLQPKLIHKPSLFAGCASDLVREGMLLSQLNHRHVLACRAYTANGMDAYSNGRHDAFCLVLDRLETTLKESIDEWRKQVKKPGLAAFIGKKRRLRQTIYTRTDLVCDLASAIAYLHSQRILHRDLKPANIGLTPDGCLKVFDLDVCRILPEESLENPNKAYKFTKRVGSPRYMAPEVAIGQPYNAKSDVYSFSLLAYELLSLKKPYGDLASQAHDRLVFRGELRPALPVYWPREVKHKLAACWDKEPTARPCMTDVMLELRADLDLMCPASEVEHHQKILPSLSEEEGRTHRSSAWSLFEQ